MGTRTTYRFISLGLFLVLLSCNLISAKITDREKVTLIKKYDIPQSILDSVSVDYFWETIRNNSPSYNSALNVAQKGRARSVQRRIGEEVAKARELYIDEEYPSELVSLLSQTILNSGILNLYPNEARLYLDPTEYETAYTLPDGSVYISYGMIKLMDFRQDLIMAIYAQQLSHFVCQHSFLYLYQFNNRLLKKKILTELFSIVTIGVSRYADMKFGELGVETTLSRNALDLTRISRRENTRKAIVDKMCYGRKLEFEADIIAYRFLSKAGYNPDCFIEMLRRLRSDIEIFSQDEKLHPLTEDRIDLIETLKSNPELKIKIKASEDDIYGYD